METLLMDNSQAKIFGDELTAIFSIYGKPEPSKMVKTIWWKTLIDHDISDVLKALDHHAGNSKFFPKPADIMEILTTNDGRPTADEAWSIALKGQDEVGSVVWTDEISQAFLSVALPILQAGDNIGARIGFRDNYNRLIERARGNHVKVHWFMSGGSDKQIRHDTAAQAESEGYLSHDAAAKHLLADMSDGGRAIAGLIGCESKSRETPPAEMKEKIEQLRKDIAKETERLQKEKEAKKKASDDKMNERREILDKQAGLPKVDEAKY